MTDLISRADVIDAIDDAIDANSPQWAILRTKIGFLPSAEADWIPCSERLPEDLAEVNVTWVNHDPEPYYDFVKDKPASASAVFYKGKWFWYSSVCADILAEYGKNDTDEVDNAIEILAWMPLPKPYREDGENGRFDIEKID